VGRWRATETREGAEGEGWGRQRTLVDAPEAPRRRPEGSDAKSRSAMGRTHRRVAAHGAHPAAVHLPLRA